jgi:hypothetical protein
MPSCCHRFDSSGRLVARVCSSEGACPTGWERIEVADCKDCPPFPVGAPAAMIDEVGDYDDLYTLRERLEAVAARFDTFPELEQTLNELTAEYDLDTVRKGIDAISHAEHRPPDDLAEELRKLTAKIERLLNPGPDDFERKLPWRRQIQLSLLVSILSEILDILRKLYGRSVQAAA